MAKNQEGKMHLPTITIDDLFSTQKERDDLKLEKVVNISLSKIDDFPNHPFKVVDDDELVKMAISIKENGILVPTIVRQKDDGRYEMISGHRRKKASALIGLEDIPCIVKDLTDDEATIIMVDSNMYREKILPSERAFAYKMKLEAMTHQGRRNDLTSPQLGQKLTSVEKLSANSPDSKSQIQRYIRLTELINPLLNMVDNKEIGFSPAVEISFLTKQEQKCNSLCQI